MLVNSGKNSSEIVASARGIGRQWRGNAFAEEELEMLTRAFSSGREVFRFLCLPPGGVEDFDPESGAGVCWTDDFSAPYPEVLNVPEEADDSWGFYLLSADIRYDDIDLPETLSVRSALPWEKEIVLREDAVITLKDVREWDSVTNRPGNPVRSDLKRVVCPSTLVNVPSP